jgi:NADPH:quinone reductase-like Zn-dependent oxidoreductase
MPRLTMVLQRRGCFLRFRGHPGLTVQECRNAQARTSRTTYRFESGKFKPVIDTEFAFTDTDVRNAFHHFGAAAHKGKIVVRT